MNNGQIPFDLNDIKILRIIFEYKNFNYYDFNIKWAPIASCKYFLYY